jgi:hemerythrin-like domain-containing protein
MCVALGCAGAMTSFHKRSTMHATMPLQIGRPPDHTFTEPLGLLSDCHRRIEYFLGVLITVTGRTPGGLLTPAQCAELEAALAYFATASPKHTADEEDSLFPRLCETHDPAAKRALKLVERLERDHDIAERHHHAVEALVRRWLADAGLERAETAKLRGHLAALQALYQRHIDVEDRELFPAAARLLSATQIADIGREMAERRSGRVGLTT